MIIIQPPAIHNVPCLGQVQEQLAIEAFIPKLAVEALHVSILPGTARFDEQCPDLGLLEPLPHRLARELRTVIAAEVAGTTTQSEQLLQGGHHVRARERPGHLDRQALPRELVHHVEHLDLPASLRPFTHEVVAPDVILVSRLTPMTGIARYADSPVFAGFPAYLKPFLLPQPMNPLIVYTPLLFTQKHRHPAIPKPRPAKRQTMYRHRQTTFLVADHQRICLRRAGLANHPADPTLRIAQPIGKIPHRLAPTSRAQEFFESYAIASFKISKSIR